MLNRLKKDFVSIGLSFIRAFVSTMVLAQGANVKDLRGVAGFLMAAAVAGIAAAFRTAQTILGPNPIPATPVVAPALPDGDS